VAVGSANQIDALSPQNLGAIEYQFVSWSDGGAQTHSFIAPVSDLILTASYQLVDMTVPTTPTGLVVKRRSKAFITLGWNGSSDTGGSGLAGYRIYRNGVEAGTTTGTAYLDFGLSSGTTYVYTVSAFDSAGNESPQSSPVTVKTKSSSGGGCYAFCHQ